MNTKKSVLDYMISQYDIPNKYKDYLWFDPSQGKFLFMDVFQDWDVYDMLKKGQLRYLGKALHQGDWMLKFTYVHIEYEIIDNRAYLILNRKKSNNIIESYRCAYCYNKHTHGTLDGHRIAHCGNYHVRETVTALDGTVLNKENGYIIKSIQPKEYDYTVKKCNVCME